jgi:hypothetical protein
LKEFFLKQAPTLSDDPEYDEHPIKVKTEEYEDLPKGWN